MSIYYNQNYFSSSIFQYDYSAIADAIIEQYKPKSIIEFGCGNGELSMAFAARGVLVEAIDGYSSPDFKHYPNIRFSKVDLNNIEDVNIFLSSLGKKFDISMSFEVAEHLIQQFR